jgi:hypothetical protein
MSKKLLHLVVDGVSEAIVMDRLDIAGWRGKAAQY